MIAQHGVLADGRQATADQVLAARRRPGTHTTQPTGTVTGGQSAALGADGATSEPVTPTEPAVNPVQELENPAPPTTTASDGALVRSVVAPRKDLQRLVGVRHASATVNWRERVCLPPGVCQHMLEAMPSSSPREIADAAGYRYNLNSSQIATARNRLTAMAHTERAIWLSN